MKARLLAVLIVILVLPSGSSAQDGQAEFRFGFGMKNYGQLASEKSRFVRAPSMPGSMQAVMTVDILLYKGVRFATRLSMNPTNITIAECKGPCKTYRFNYRPEGTEYSPSMNMYEVHGGLRFDGGWFDLALGVSFHILDGEYIYYGAVPMMVRGYWGEVRFNIPLPGNLVVGPACGITLIPPGPGRWTVLSEMSGYKENGEDFPLGRDGDPLWINPVYCDILIGLR